MTYLFFFAAALVATGLKATQQLQVTHDQYARIVPTSLALTSVEYGIVAGLVQQGWGATALAGGLGAGLGTILAMWLHRRLRK